MGAQHSTALIQVNSGEQHHGARAALCNGLMRPVEETRRLRLAQLVATHGSYVTLNGLLGMTDRDSTLSQIANQSPNSRTRKPKNMGSELARRIEAALGLAPGWMDADPDAEWPLDRVSRQRYGALSDADRAYVQGLMNQAITECEQRTAAPAGPAVSSGNGLPAPTLHDSAGKRYGT